MSNSAVSIKKGIQNMRLNLTNKIWKFSDNASVLSEIDWIANVKKDLSNFEKEILVVMKSDGFDGDEDVSKSQWTFAGSLFYSIIVITTIGYGHISPRTELGKLTTIFYAIMGIPLMLLCLSNIGDVMATSFRFIYWRVCCYICTRTSNRTRHRSRQYSIRLYRYAPHSQPSPVRRSIKLTQRSTNDSGIGPLIGLPHAYSDPELRTLNQCDYVRDFHYGRNKEHCSTINSKHHQDVLPSHGWGKQFSPCLDGRYQLSHHIKTVNRGSRFNVQLRNSDRLPDRHTIERERYINHSEHKYDSLEDVQPLGKTFVSKRSFSIRSIRRPPLWREDTIRNSRESHDSSELFRLGSQPISRGVSMPNTTHGWPKSRNSRPRTTYYQTVDENVVRKTPIISNRYVIDEFAHRESRYKKQNVSRNPSIPCSANCHKSKYAQESQSAELYHKIYHRHQSPYLDHQQRRYDPQRPQQLHHSSYSNRLELPEVTSNTHIPHLKRIWSPHCDNYERNRSYLNEQELDIDYNDHSMNQFRSRERNKRRERSERLPPSPRIMSPMGFAVKRQVRPRPSSDYEEDSLYGDELNERDNYGEFSQRNRPVPIWLCVFLVISYIIGGAALFAYWEEWSFLDSAYFCFITLTTIGFGDFVPAKGVKDESEQSIAYCSLYLLFGIALLAMSFNLVQEEFISNVKQVARRLGILKDEEDEE